MTRRRTRRYYDEEPRRGGKHRLFKTRTWMGILCGVFLFGICAGAIMAQPDDITKNDDTVNACSVGQYIVKNAVINFFEEVFTKIHNSVMKVMPYEFRM